MAIASLWGLSNTDRKSAPRTSVRAAISFRTFSNEMGIETSIRVSMSEACVLLTPESNRYRALTTKINPINPVSSATMQMRKTNSEAAILLAVAVASPDTTK